MDTEETYSLIQLAKRVCALHKNRMHISTDDIGVFQKLANELANRVIMECEPDGLIIGQDYLRVLISTRGNHWLAQGLEFGFDAAGQTPGHAKDNFLEGILRAIKTDLDTLTILLKPAPNWVWETFYTCVEEDKLNVSVIKWDEIEAGTEDAKKAISKFFSGIKFIVVEFEKPETEQERESHDS